MGFIFEDVNPRFNLISRRDLHYYFVRLGFKDRVASNSSVIKSNNSHLDIVIDSKATLLNDKGYGFQNFEECAILNHLKYCKCNSTRELQNFICLLSTVYDKQRSEQISTEYRGGILKYADNIAAKFMEVLYQRKHFVQKCSKCEATMKRCKCMDTDDDYDDEDISYDLDQGLLKAGMQVINFIRTRILRDIVGIHPNYRMHGLAEFIEKSDTMVRHHRHQVSKKATRFLIYLIVDWRHGYSYIGQTAQGATNRFCQHMKGIHDPSKKDQLPAYDIFRRLGLSGVVMIPLLFLEDSSSMTLRYIEKQFITWWQPKCNMPFVAKYTKISQTHVSIRFRKWRETVVNRIKKMSYEWKINNSEIVVPRSKNTLNQMLSIGSPELILYKIGRMHDKQYHASVTMEAKRLIVENGHDYFMCMLKKIEVMYRGEELFKARSRWLQAGNYASFVSRQGFQFKVFDLPGVNMAKAVNSMLAKCLSEEIPRVTRQRMITLAATSKKYKSVKEYLCNFQRVCQNIDCEDLPCTCEELCSKLNVKMEGKHLCVRLCDTNVIELLPKVINLESKIIPEVNVFCEDLHDQIEALIKRVKRALNIDFAVNVHSVMKMIVDTYRMNGHYEDNYLTVRVLKQIKTIYDDIAVIVPVDKNKSTIAFMCPRYYQNRMFKLFLMNPSVTFETKTEEEFHCRCDLMRKKFWYTGANVKKKETHRWSFAKAWPKESDLGKKDRPLGDYSDQSRDSKHTY